MNSKKISIAAYTGLSVYCIVKQESSGKKLDNIDGGFRFSPPNPYIFFVEDSVIKGRYDFSENRQVWRNGVYSFTAYAQNGTSPDPVNDLILGIKSMYVKDNSEVFIEQVASSIDWSKMTPTISVDITQVLGE
jgi:hypothetical protein